MNTEIAGKAVKRKKHQIESAGADQAPVAVAMKSDGPTIRTTDLARKIAENTLGFQKNFRFKDAEKLFPHEPRLRTVEKYYPNAIGGPLLVDEPNYKIEAEECRRKAMALKKLGYRYLVLNKDTDEIGARQQLGEA